MESKTLDGVNSPLFILAPPSTLTAVAGAALGQHPQMYGLPELQLFGAETMVEWWDLCSKESFPMAHGLLRAVAQLYFGKQTRSTIQRAQGWLRRRSNFSTGMIFEMLAQKAKPLVLVDKSPGIVYRTDLLHRAAGMFPGARFIHLVQHPRSYCEWVMSAIRESEKSDPVPYWLLHLASFPDLSARDGWIEHAVSELDPQKGWYVLHMNTCEFLESIPEDQKLRIMVEDWFSSEETGTLRVLSWMGLRTDFEALEAMRHPDRSPYSCLGPAEARFGNDAFFLHNPDFRPTRVERQRLAGPLGWQKHDQGFLPEVKQLAKQFGYQ